MMRATFYQPIQKIRKKLYEENRFDKSKHTNYAMEVNIDG